MKGSSNVEYDGCATWSLLNTNVFHWHRLLKKSKLRRVLCSASMSKFWRKRKNCARKTRVATSFVILLSQRTWRRRTSQAQVKNLKQCHQLTRTCSVLTLGCRINWLEYFYEWIFSRIFENIPQNRPEYPHRSLSVSQVSSHCGENKHRELAVLVGLIVKLSPWANSPRVGKGPPYQSLGGGGSVLQKCGTALYSCCGSQCTRHVCRKLVMSNSCSVWGLLANESIPLKHLLGWGGGESQGGWCGLEFSA